MKKLHLLLSACLLFACFHLSAQAPFNDECLNAINITPTKNVIEFDYTGGTTFNGTESVIPGKCSPNGFRNLSDIWFKFTAINDSHLLNLTDLTQVNGINLNGTGHMQLLSLIHI